MRFKVVKLQINNILILTNKIFVAAEKVKLPKIKLLPKVYN